jgi:hypothetical protein
MYGFVNQFSQNVKKGNHALYRDVRYEEEAEACHANYFIRHFITSVR